MSTSFPTNIKDWSLLITGSLYVNPDKCTVQSDRIQYVRLPHCCCSCSIPAFVCVHPLYESHVTPAFFSFFPALPSLRVRSISVVPAHISSCRLKNTHIQQLLTADMKKNCLAFLFFFSISLLILADWDGVREESVFCRAKLLLWINLLSNKHKPKSWWMTAALMSNYLNWPLK